MDPDDELDDDGRDAGWVDPDDRLWRHPSEVAGTPWPATPPSSAGLALFVRCVVVSTTIVSTLAESFPGRVLGPDSGDYDTARRPPIARFQNIEPQAVVRCLDENDVIRALTFVRDQGLEFAVRSGGRTFRYTLPAGAVATFQW